MIFRRDRLCDHAGEGCDELNPVAGHSILARLPVQASFPDGSLGVSRRSTTLARSTGRFGDANDSCRTGARLLPDRSALLIHLDSALLDEGLPKRHFGSQKIRQLFGRQLKRFEIHGLQPGLQIL